LTKNEDLVRLPHLIFCPVQTRFDLQQESFTTDCTDGADETESADVFIRAIRAIRGLIF